MNPGAIVDALTEGTAASVLIVDDEEPFLKVCRLILSPEGYRVHVATNGKRSMEVMREHQPDIVLVDLRLQDTDGLSLLKEIKGEFPDTVVSIITGFATIASSVEAMNAGAYDYVEKPLSTTELRVLVERSADYSKLVRTNRELQRKVEEVQQHAQADGPDTLIRLFDFPAPIRTACEQYLLYFTQFLQDLGISAETDIRHRAGRVLFSITPRDGSEALGRIRDALEIFLELPSIKNFDDEIGYDADIAVRQLQAQLLHFKGQLALAGAVLQAKNATIEQLSLSNARYRELLVTSEEVERVTKSLLEKPESQEEPLLGGILTVTEYQGPGFKLDLAALLRRLKRSLGGE